MNHQKHKTLNIGKLEHPRVLFFVVSINFIVGIWLGSYGAGLQEYLLIIGFGIFLTFILGYRGFFLYLWIVVFGLCGTYITDYSYSKRVATIEWFSKNISNTGSKLQLSGILEKELYRTETTQAYRLYIDNFATISTGSIDIYYPGILLELPKNLSHGVGDTLIVEGKIKSPYSGSIDGFEKYTFFHNIAGTISVSSFARTESSTNTLFGMVGDKIEKYIFQGFPRDVAGVVLGMSIGRVELMSEDLQEKFRLSGISHILVVSGSNITFLIVFISGCIRYIPVRKNTRIAFIIGFILFYSSLVGWDVPVIRATIMGLIGFFVVEQGSRTSSLAILLGVAWGFLVFSPLSLIYDPAFGLSFGATLSIILYYRTIDKKIQSKGVPSILSSILSITFAASIGTLPVTIYHFGSISLGFLFANIAIALVVGWILFFTVFYVVISILGGFFLYFIGFFVYIPTLYIIWVSEFFGSWGMIEVPVYMRDTILTISFGLILMETLKIEKIFPDRIKKIHDQK